MSMAQYITQQFAYACDENFLEQVFCDLLPQDKQRH